MNQMVEKFLEIQTYEEFDKRRGEFKGLSIVEPGVREHLRKLSPRVDNEISDGIIREAF